ncbi:MAG: CheR family methyltransferase [Phycisphaerales bacterium]
MNDPATVRAWFAAHTPLEPTLFDGAAFRHAIAARMRELGIGDEATFARRLEADAVEAARAQSLVAVPETWLFRGLASFELLMERLAAMRARGATAVRLLSAGCANGAEPWSMAIAARAAGFAPECVRIDAVDLNPDVVALVDSARFTGLSIRDGVPSWAEPWVEQAQGAVVLKPALHGVVRVTSADLFSWAPSMPIERYAAIFCRNVLIYLEAGARVRLLERLISWLATDGTLYLGHADSALGAVEGFASAGPVGAFALERATTRQRRGPAPPPRSASIAEPLVARGTSQQRGMPAPAKQRPASALPDDVSGLLERGEALFAESKWSEAEECFRRVVYLDPRHEHALVRLAEIAERTERTKIADRFRARALRAHLENEAERSD